MMLRGVVCLFLLVLVSPAVSSDNTYRDLNGDGLNDLLPDRNGDGIPESFRPEHTASTSTETPVNIGDSFTLLKFSGASTAATAHRFLARQFALRGLILQQAIQLGTMSDNSRTSDAAGQGCVGGACTGP